uniref:Small G protein family protein / RhoGAP family protein n=1 Tax=Zea mays TaxID=4577 RepID=C0PIW7_MAIZE|nr:unknown [Zea mays]
MPLAEPPQWRRKATDFFSTSSVKLKQAGQSAGDNIADVAGKVGSAVKSRWVVFQEARQQQQQQRPPHETVQERIITAAATTGLLFRKGISETKEKVAVGKVKVEEAAKKTADKSKSILNNIERWQKVCDLEFCYLVTQFDLFFVYNADSHFCLFVPGSRKH